MGDVLQLFEQLQLQEMHRHFDDRVEVEGKRLALAIHWRDDRSVIALTFLDE